MLKRTPHFRALAAAALVWFLSSCAAGATQQGLQPPRARPVQVTLVDGRALVLAQHSAVGDSLIGYVGDGKIQEPERVALGWDEIRSIERVSAPTSIATAALVGVAVAAALYVILVKIAYSGAHS